VHVDHTFLNLIACISSISRKRANCGVLYIYTAVLFHNNQLLSNNQRFAKAVRMKREGELKERQ